MMKTRAPKAVLRRLRADRRGALAPAAACILVPITLLAFGAVEFNRYAAVRSNVQDALDAAALAVARSSSRDPALLQQTGEAVLRAQIPFNADLRLTSFTVTLNEGAVVADAVISISPIISSMFRSGDLRVASHSEVLREAGAMEIALVLDNTWSMNTNDRIGITKTAAKNFIDTVGGAGGASTTPDAVKIGLVPFSATVNVGSRYAGSTWMDRNAQSPIHDDIFTTSRGLPVNVNRFTLLSSMNIAWAGCVESRPYPYDVQDTAPSTTSPGTLFVPYFAPDEMDYVPNGALYHREWAGENVQSFAYPNSYVPEIQRAIREYDRQNNFSGRLGNYWRGFLIDFRTNYWAAFMNYTNGYRGVQGVVDKYNGAAVDAEVAAGRFSRTSLYEGPNRGCAVKPLTRLTSDYEGLKTAVDAMTPDGSTNIPMGLVWGWHVLSPSAPFSDGTAYDTQGVKKIAVLMTDGENSLTTEAGSDPANLNGSEYSGVGYVWQNRLGTTSGDWTTRRNAMDARLTELCTNMKAKGVVIYTI
ncbi:MAG: pilus assembly protein TadG-related protein, partial [Pseudomonadota bacterium]|nr:pilus assembly protein TadG-related protein [Pseudomonadota bacterium]